MADAGTATSGYGKADLTSHLIQLNALLHPVRVRDVVTPPRSQIATNAGHPNLQGASREGFVEVLLVNHMHLFLSIGQGEIIVQEKHKLGNKTLYRFLKLINLERFEYHPVRSINYLLLGNGIVKTLICYCFDET